MPPVIGVLADDLTGALASAARLRDGGLRCVVRWRREPVPATADAVVADMRTRDYGGDGYARARGWAAHLRALGCTRLELRCDSTLRGDPGAETAGALEGWAVADPWVLAVPGFPEAGRLVRDGRLEVPGLRGSGESVVGADVGAVLFPGEAVTLLPLSLVETGPDAVVHAVTTAAGDGARRFLADAIAEAHLRCLARAAGLLVGRKAPLVTVSPGAWLRYLPASPAAPRYVLAVVSSATPTNREQLAALARHGTVLALDAGAFLAGRVTPDWARLRHGGVTVVVETLSAAPQGRVDGWMLSAIAARAARWVLDEGSDRGYACGGVVASGGQTASALMDALEADGVDAEGEAAPLCPRGRVRGGPWSGLRLVTKGGLVGAADTLAGLTESLCSAESVRR